MNGRGVFRIDDMVAGNVGVQASDGSYVCAVPEPFYFGLLGRIRGAWQVVIGSAYPVEWPEAGDLERALRRGGRQIAEAAPSPSVRGAGR